jgi:hypothetical protein
MSEPEYTDLETVFEGEISEADVLRSVLEAAILGAPESRS